MKHIPSSSEETAEISLRLEQYDDIFSDFDIRPYSKRALSVDFLDEIKRAAYDKNDGGIELAMHMPAHVRNEAHEIVIRERLTAHFKKHFQILKAEKRRVLGIGMAMMATGVIFMIAATSIVFENTAGKWLMSFLVVFLEPAAWFLLWEGMDQIIFNAKSINPSLDFYRKMSDSHGHIHFRSY